MFRVLAAAALLAAAAGCQPSWSIHGQVAAAPAAGADAEAPPRPLANAKVTLRCPSAKGAGVVERTVTTDPMGYFELEGSGPGPSLECVVVAQHPGHAPFVASLDDVCADDGEGEDRCVSATMLATLDPQK